MFSMPTEMDWTVIILCLPVVCSTNLENNLKCLYCPRLLGVLYMYKVKALSRSLPISDILRKNCT